MYQDIVELKELGDVDVVNHHLDRGWHFLQAVPAKNGVIYVVGRTAATRLQEQATGEVDAGRVPVSVVEELPGKMRRATRPPMAL